MSAQMTDKKLLELSAKAAGFIGSYYKGVLNDEWVNGIIFIRYDGQQRIWNPLEDDADALRLAVQLVIDIKPPRDREDYALAKKFTELEGSYAHQYNGDTFAATRCAIVKEAAEIGKSMQ